MRKYGILTFVFLFFLFFLINASALTYIDSCQTLSTENETYEMNASIDAGGIYCLNITAYNITLDCKGYEIYNNSIAVLVSNDYTNVNNCIINGSTTKAFGLNGDYTNLENNTVIKSYGVIYIDSSPTPENLLINNMYAFDINDYFLRFVYSVSKITISNSLFVKSANGGIWFSGANEIIISNVTIMNVTQYGCLSLSSITGLINNITIRDSVFNNCGGFSDIASVTFSMGLGMFGSNIIIDNVIIEKSSASGIRIDNMINVSVSDVDISNVNEEAIRFRPVNLPNTFNVFMENVNISNTTNHGISVTNVTNFYANNVFMSNVSTASSKYAFNFIGNMSNVTLSNFVLNNTGGGVYLDSGVSYDIKIENATVNNINRANSYGIYLATLNNVSVKNCLISGLNTVTGIFATGNNFVHDNINMTNLGQCFNLLLNNSIITNLICDQSLQTTNHSVTTNGGLNNTINNAVFIGNFSNPNRAINIGTNTKIINLKNLDIRGYRYGVYGGDDNDDIVMDSINLVNISSNALFFQCSSTLLCNNISLNNVNITNTADDVFINGRNISITNSVFINNSRTFLLQNWNGIFAENLTTSKSRSSFFYIVSSNNTVLRNLKSENDTTLIQAFSAPVINFTVENVDAKNSSIFLYLTSLTNTYINNVRLDGCSETRPECTGMQLEISNNTVINNSQVYNTGQGINIYIYDNYNYTLQNVIISENNKKYYDNDFTLSNSGMLGRGVCSSFFVNNVTLSRGGTILLFNGTSFNISNIISDDVYVICNATNSIVNNITVSGLRVLFSDNTSLSDIHTTGAIAIRTSKNVFADGLDAPTLGLSNSTATVSNFDISSPYVPAGQIYTTNGITVAFGTTCYLNNATLNGNYVAILISESPLSYVNINNMVINNSEIGIGYGSVNQWVNISNAYFYNIQNHSIYFNNANYNNTMNVSNSVLVGNVTLVCLSANCTRYSFVDFFNTTFGNYNITKNATLNVYWKATMNNPLSALAEIRDAFGTLVNSFSDSRSLWLKQYSITSGNNLTNSTPHVINATKSGYYPFSQIFNMDSNKEFTILLSEFSIKDQMPSITGQLVLTLGFGIMGIMSIFTLLGFGYLTAAGKPDPETIAKIMIGIGIVILMIVAVWQGIVLPP